MFAKLITLVKSGYTKASENYDRQHNTDEAQQEPPKKRRRLSESGELEGRPQEDTLVESLERRIQELERQLAEKDDEIERLREQAGQGQQQQQRVEEEEENKENKENMDEAIVEKEEKRDFKGDDGYDTVALGKLSPIPPNKLLGDDDE